MVSVELMEDKEARLTLDTRFYPYEAVLQAAHAFGESCWVCLDGDPHDRLLVCLKPKGEDIRLSELGYEFFNYVLGLVKNAVT